MTLIHAFRARWRDRVSAAQADGRHCRRSTTGSRSSTPSSTARSIIMTTLFGVSLEEPPPVLPADQDRRAELGQRRPPAGHRGLTLTGSTPAKYENWLTQLIEHANTVSVLRRGVCVRECLERVVRGRLSGARPALWGAYLNATSRAVTGVSQRTNCPRLVLIGHDAFPERGAAAAAQHRA